MRTRNGPAQRHEKPVVDRDAASHRLIGGVVPIAVANHTHEALRTARDPDSSLEVDAEPSQVVVGLHDEFRSGVVHKGRVAAVCAKHGERPSEPRCNDAEEVEGSVPLSVVNDRVCGRDIE